MSIYYTDPLEPRQREAAQQIRSEDALIGYKLELMKVRVYLNTLARGHVEWANVDAPSLESLEKFRTHLGLDFDDIGHQYVELLDSIIEQKTSK